MKYIIREGKVRGQGRYLAVRARWSVDIQPALWWPEHMRLHVVDVARERGGRVVRLTTKVERAVRKELGMVVRKIRWVAAVTKEHHPEGASALLGVATAIERGDHRKGE